MAGRRKTIAEQLAETDVGTNLPPGKQTVQPKAPAPKVVAQAQPETAGQDGSPQPGAASAGEVVPRGTTSAVPVFDDRLPAGIRQALEAELPTTSEDPARISAACEQRVKAATTLHDAMQHRATEVFFHHAGPAVRLMKATRAWEEQTDPSTGRPFRSYSAWLRYVKVSRTHAYRMTDEQPVAEALAPLDPGPLGSKQVEVLAPVLRAHGGEAVRHIWESAHESDDTSAPALAKIRDLLGYGAREVEPARDDDGTGMRTALPVLRIVPGRFSEDQVRQAARANPDLARLVAATLLDEIKHLDGDEVVPRGTTSSPEPAE